MWVRGKLMRAKVVFDLLKTEIKEKGQRQPGKRL